MNTETSKSAWNIEDSRSFQLSVAAVYSPLVLMFVAAFMIF